MRLRTTLAMIGVSLLTNGCQLCWDITKNVAFETCLFTDTMKSKIQYRHQASEAWKEYLSCHEGGDYSADFTRGFKTGYAEFLAEGGNTCPPPAPPVKYWKIKYQNAAGRAATDLWSAGYREGATVAKASGARNYIIVPINKPTPPVVGPTPATPMTNSGTPGLAPGATVLPPGSSYLPRPIPPPVSENELPAPRPAPGEAVPLRDGKTSSANPTAP